MDRLSDIRLFVDAAQLGSFTSAGRKHGLSPAAASACIQRLEAQLGVKLFERTTRQLRLTEEGQLLLDYGQQALEALAEVTQILQAGQGEVKGMIRLSAPSDLGRNRLVDELEAFRQVYPEISYSLSLSDSMANLVNDDIDVAIRYGMPPDSSLVARKLADSWRVVCVAPTLADRVGRPAEPDDLARLPVVVLNNAGGRVDGWRYRHGAEGGGGGEPRTVRVGKGPTTNDGDVARKWALQGVGYAYKSVLDVVDDVREGRLELVLPTLFVEPAPLNAVYHRNRFQPPRVRLLVEFLQARFTGLLASLPA